MILSLLALACWTAPGETGDRAAAERRPACGRAVEAQAWYRDEDRDGYGSEVSAGVGCGTPDHASTRTGDCDDADATVFPGAPERCDGDDHDCDGDSGDAPAGAGYADRDGDGYGDPDAPLAACPGDPGVVADATDCDDGLAGVHPGAGERCVTSGRDDDCDGLVDDDDPDVEDQVDGWPDRDGDGYGDASVAPRPACVIRSDEVPEGSDCDDTRDDIHPSADEPACAAGVDRDCDGVAVDLDVDGDGVTACDDCDDADPAIFPGAPERCDEADDDCNGAIDDGIEVPTWFLDNDGDGFGLTDVSITRCEAPDDAAPVGGDCDDEHASVHPGAAETCFTSFDDDCDGVANPEDSPDCSDFTLDADGDGYGDDEAGTRCLCSVEGAWLSRELGDCDDRDADVAPGAPDVCGDGVDADCDGEDRCDYDTLDLVVSGTGSGGHLGEAVLVDADLDGDGVGDLVVGQPGGTSDRVFAWSGGAAPALGGATWSWDPAAPTRLGYALASGDSDHDGTDELFMGHPDRVRRSARIWGAVVVVEAGAPGTTTTVMETTLLAAWYGDREAGTLGEHIAWVGDIGGDTVERLAVADTAPASGDAGAVYLVDTTDRGEGYAADADLAVVAATGASTGSILAAGDLDGDATADLVVDDGSGLVILVGPLAGRVTTDAADTRLDLPDVSTTRLVNDVNGDGLPDLLTEQPDAVALFVAPTSASAWARRDAAWAAGLEAGESAALGAGCTADLDGDGVLDVAVRQTGDDAGGADAGAILLYLGPLRGFAAPSDASVTLRGPTAGARAGWRIDPLGDRDGDGRDDLLVGTLDPDGTGTEPGELRLLWGSLVP